MNTWMKTLLFCKSVNFHFHLYILEVTYACSLTTYTVKKASVAFIKSLILNS